jgi:hypothetical protein
MGRKFKILDVSNQTLAIVVFAYVLHINRFVGLIILPNLERHETCLFENNSEMKEIIKELTVKIGIKEFNNYVEL